MPFCDLISLFSHLKFDSQYELAFWNEIYGCVNYLNLPYETVMNMPIYVRKFWIQKHNKMAEEREQPTNSGNGKTITGEALNDFAAIEQGQS